MTTDTPTDATPPLPSAPPSPPTVPDLPIHELLALEAVSRLGSVQAAADDLHVTPSGVSHRIASLEQRIGRPLLQRRGRGVGLTDVAEAYVATVRPGLTALATATEALLDRAHRTVRIATAAAIGAGWLLPLLRRHARQQPALRFELLTVALPDELPPDRWDLMVHYGRPAPRGARRSVLFTERLIQVCAPGLAGPAPVLRLAQLDVPKAAGAPRRAAETSHAQLVFDDALAMLEAASAGAGVAWSTETAARAHLRSGRLVQAGVEARPGHRYTADLSESGQLKPAAVACYRFLVDEAAAGAPGLA